MQCRQIVNLRLCLGRTGSTKPLYLSCGRVAALLAAGTVVAMLLAAGTVVVMLLTTVITAAAGSVNVANLFRLQITHDGFLPKRRLCCWASEAAPWRYRGVLLLKGHNQRQKSRSCGIFFARKLL